MAVCWFPIFHRKDPECWRAAFYLGQSILERTQLQIFKNLEEFSYPNVISDNDGLRRLKLWIGVRQSRDCFTLLNPSLKHSRILGQWRNCFILQTALSPGYFPSPLASVGWGPLTEQCPQSTSAHLLKSVKFESLKTLSNMDKVTCPKQWSRKKYLKLSIKYGIQMSIVTNSNILSKSKAGIYFLKLNIN